MFSYHDLFVVCGEMAFHDQVKDVFVNPTVIFEVLSESTEKFDRGEKFLRYQNFNPTLMDYILVSQTSATIEHFSRQSDGSWKYRVHTGLNASFTIAAIKCRVKLDEVYERVNFKAEDIGAISEQPKKRAARKIANGQGKKR